MAWNGGVMSGNGHRLLQLGHQLGAGAMVGGGAARRLQAMSGHRQQHGLHVVGQHMVAAVQQHPGAGGAQQRQAGP